MNHTILRYKFHLRGIDVDMLTAYAELAWKASEEISTNHWIPLQFVDEGVWALYKTRGYRASENLLGWGVLVVPNAFFDTVEALPEDERDNYLVNLFGLEGEDAAWWTARY